MTAQHVKLTSTPADAAAVKGAVKVLDSGGLVVVALETLYAGLARIDNSAALSRLRKLRSTPEDRPLALHVGSPAAALDYIDEPSAHQRHLMAKLWPGPVAIVFDVSAARREAAVARLRVPMQDLYEDGQLTVRCPAHKTTRDVLSGCRHPLAAAAAGDQPKTVAAIPQELLRQVDMVLDDGPVRHGRPSTVIRATEHDFEIVRTGVYDRRIIEKMLQTTILFVCSGNTCRSPMAQAIARKVLADSLKIPQSELEKASYQVISAGTSAIPGAPATAYAAEAVKELGADLSSHRSRPLTQQLVSQATVIIAMTENHAEAVRLMDPSAASKVVLLDTEGDIEDPIGGELALYKNLAAKIKGIIERRLADKSLLGLGEVQK